MINIMNTSDNIFPNKRKPIKISWCGNEDCLNKNRNNILDALGNGSLQWSRDSTKSSNFPLNLRFTPLFEVFNPETSIAGNIKDTTHPGLAFIHIYFIYITNPEEYRMNVRSEISEWFATLNEANCQNWVIIFDSSRSKDKKSRAMTMDKLKSDFTRFQNRLFESSEFSSEKAMASLATLLQSNLFASLENFVQNSSSNLQKLKEIINESTFSPASLVNEQFRLAFFYWDLGLYEMASSEMDSLASFMADSIHALAQKNDAAVNSLVWLKHLRLLPLDKCCTLLSTQMYIDSASDDWPLVKIHSHLLAHRILLSIQLLNHKLNIAATAPDTVEEPKSSQKAKDEPPNVQLNTLQIRHDFLKAMLGYARETFQRIEEDLIVLKANYNPILLHCLHFIWQAEILKFGEYMLGSDGGGGKLVEIESISTHINFFLHKKCEAIIHFHSIMATKKQQEITIARRWLEQTSPLTVPSEMDSGGGGGPVDRFFAAMFTHFSQIFSYDAEKMENFTRSELAEAMDTFRRFGWKGHAHYLANYIAGLSRLSTANSYTFTRDTLMHLINGEDLHFGNDAIHYLDKTLRECKQKMIGKDRELLFDCCLILLYLTKDEEEEGGKEGSKVQIESILAELAQSNNFTPIRNNSAWLEYADSASASPKQDHHHHQQQSIMPFPLKIARICSPPLLHCVLHKSASLQIDIKNHLPITLDNCTLTAKFGAKHARPIQLPNNIAFRQTCSANGTNSNAFYNLECLFPPSTSIQKQNEEEEGEASSGFEAKITGCSLPPDRSKQTFQINMARCQKFGCFRLDSIQIECPDRPKCTFVLNYHEEMSKNRLLEHVFCFMDIVKPAITILKEEGERRDEKAPLCLAAGMRQRFWLELSAGTKSFEQPTQISVALVGTGNGQLKFKENPSEGEWTNVPAIYPIPPLGPNGRHPLCIPVYMGIDRVSPSTSDDERIGGQFETAKFEIDLQWRSGNDLLVQQFLALNFKPIFAMKSTTSLLAGNAIFIVDILRDKSHPKMGIVPLDANLSQEQNIALDPVPAQLLNSKSFKPIVANSSFRFIWRLPDSSIGKAVPVPHFFELRYRVESEEEEGDGQEEGGNSRHRRILAEDYQIKKRLDFPLQRVEYEICARFYSEHSQSVLCRIDQPCDLVVSLRSLAKLVEAETLIVDIETENAHWQCGERHKLAKVKDSGVGQAIFTVVPKMLGYLPFPSISIYKYNISDHSPSRQHSLNEKHFGERMVAFYRNKGSQIHILAPVQHSDETASFGSANTSESEQKKKSLKSQAKDRLQKLFE